MPAEVRLEVGLEAGELRLTWPVTPETYVLQETETLMDSTWSLVLIEPALVDDTYTLQLPVTGTARYYRLTR